MLHTISTYFNSAQATALVVFLFALIPALYKWLKPFVQAKIKTEKNAHVKQALELGLKFADTIVPEMAVMEALSKSDRKKEAMRFVNAQLKANGFDLDIQTVAGLVEKAYQAYKHAGGDTHFSKPVPAPDDTKVAPTQDGATVDAKLTDQGDQNGQQSN